MRYATIRYGKFFFLADDPRGVLTPVFLHSVYSKIGRDPELVLAILPTSSTDIAGVRALI
jgi:hypothetical protein